MDAVDRLQAQYKNLMKSGRVTKDSIIQTLKPFRDRHGLTDRQTFVIARGDIGKTKIKDLFCQLAEANVKTITPYSTGCGNIALSIWWYMRLDGVKIVIIQANEYNYQKVVKTTYSQLVQGYKTLKWLSEIQPMHNEDYRRIKQEIIQAVQDSDYRLDTLD